MPRSPGPAPSSLLAGLVAGAVAGCTALFGVDGDYRAETEAGAAADATAETGGGHDGATSPEAEGAAPPVEAGADVSDAFPPQPGPVAEVTAGRFHTCVRFGSGVAMCWGRDEDFGELGNGTMVSTSVAEPAMGSGLTKLVAGAHDTCGLLADGGVCAGKGGTGELANGVGDADVPYPVATTVLPAPPTAIASGESFTCAVVAGGDVYCVGNGAGGTLGNGTTGISLAAVQVSLQGKKASAIAAFNAHACALLVDGAVWCWGDGSSGQLGNGVSGPDAGSPVPVAVQGLPGAASAVGVGDDYSCAIVGNDANSTVWCWGANAFGQLGNGDSTVPSSATPLQVKGVKGAASLACGAGHACIGNDYIGGIWCWGKGGSGQLGNDDTGNAVTPVQVSGIGAFPQSLAAGGFHTCAVLSSPNVVCWGANDFGQLGDGTTNQEQVPTPVTGIP